MTNAKIELTTVYDHFGIRWMMATINGVTLKGHDHDWKAFIAEIYMLGHAAGVLTAERLMTEDEQRPVYADEWTPFDEFA